MSDRLKHEFKEHEGKQDKRSEKTLILHNDDIHSFDYVIENLVEICNHTPEQAEQCALMTHYKGLCDVKKGEKEILRKMRTGLVKKGLKASID